MEHIVFSGLHEHYNSIALEHHEKYVVINKLYNELTSNNQSWDILSHTPDENSKYFNLYRERQNASIISIVFEAFAVEAFINCYGSEKLGKKQFDAHYSKLGVTDKYIIIPKVITGKDFPKGNHAFSMLKNLVKIRNNLVHSKCIEIDMYSEDLQGFYDQQLNLLGNGKESIFNIIDKVIYTYNELKKTISELEKETRKG